jgi:hypothetical protein
MGILDEAIREHLELKRQHGAADNELQQLEDEAFGPPARPGETTLAEAPAADEAPTTLQPAEGEAPGEEPPEPEPPSEPSEPLPEPEPAETSSVRAETEEHPPPEGAVEPEPAPVPEPEPMPEADATAVADQPTELYDVDGGEASDTGTEPVEDEFFSEQSLSDELDQALDAPEAAPEPGGSEQGVAPDLDEPPDLGDEEPAAEEPLPEEGEDGEDGEDVLEETPEFLQDSPEHDRLWFEQKPPKDFDFDD